MKTIEVPVFIVGAGPTGLAVTDLLATYGIKTLTITRYPGTANSPRAHITNQRCMEVFRDLGMEDRIQAIATPNEYMSNNIWATSFAGPEIARLQAWGTSPERQRDYARSSPSGMCNAPQHRMEPVMLEVARERGAEFLFNTLLVSMTQDAESVTSICKDVITGEEIKVISQYAIGADGDNSVVVKEIGFETVGQMGLGAAVNCWLEVDLSKYTAHRPGVLYWMTQPGNNYWVGSGTWINVSPWNEWVLLFMYDPKDGEPDLSEAAVIERARATIGDDSIPIKVKAASKWTINHVHALSMRKGRVLIAGNAAHRHPPANGLGTNTCVQDAFNLSWKLAMVLKGEAGEALLDTYSVERTTVAKQVVDRAMKSVGDMLPISDALGFKPGQNAAEGWANVDELFSNSDRGRERRQSLKAAVELQNYQFNCNGVELGQTYVSDAVIQDGTAMPAPTRDPELYYEPNTFPGRTLPHAWLQRNHGKLSTLDLVGKGRFTVLTGVGGDEWKAAAKAVSEKLGIEVHAVSIGGPNCDAQDVYGTWTDLRAVSDSGCLLVRPDRHVAWRKQTLTSQPAADLEAALRQILAR